MSEPREKRQVSRTLLPRQLSVRLRDVKEARLLDLSPAGARLEHLGLLRPGALCYLELPAVLGGLVLATHVVWSIVIGRRTGLDGERHVLSHAGLRFSPLTADQHSSLGDALQHVPPRHAAPRHAALDTDLRSA